MNFEADFKLTGMLKVENRIRYTLWDLLSDVGGFNDGLYLICQLFMGSYSALAFKVNYLNNMFVNKAKDKVG